MSMTDPLADLFSGIKNAGARGHEKIIVPSSKLKAAVLRILKSEGFIHNFHEDQLNGHPALRVDLRYLPGRKKQLMISGIKRISKPGCRVYVGKNEIPEIMGGLGISILSTSKGVMTDKECRKNNIGGEILGAVW